MAYPDKDRILEVMDKINKGRLKSTNIIGKDASPIDRMKFNICQQIIKFKRVNDYNNKELSQIVGVGPAVISRVLHCQIERFKVDSLLRYYLCLLTSTNDKKLMKKFSKKLADFLSKDAA